MSTKPQSGGSETATHFPSPTQIPAGLMHEYDCGCQVRGDPAGGFAIHACPLHNAAPELLEACRDCQEVMNATARLFVDDDHPGRAELHARADQLDVYAMRARAAIAKATGKDT